MVSYTWSPLTVCALTFRFRFRHLGLHLCESKFALTRKCRTYNLNYNETFSAVPMFSGRCFSMYVCIIPLIVPLYSFRKGFCEI